MLKHFAAATLGFAVLFGAIGPAAADKGGHHWTDKYHSPYVYPYSYSYGAQSSPKYVARTRSRSRISGSTSRPRRCGAICGPHGSTTKLACA